LVAYTNIRRDGSSPAMIHIDQPWVHVDVKGKFYIYKPEIGQILRGKQEPRLCVEFMYCIRPLKSLV